MSLNVSMPWMPSGLTGNNAIQSTGRMEQYTLPDASNPRLRFLEPFGLFDFVALEKNALCILSDSGTVQEESALFGVPNVTLRDVTERPETLECGSNMLSGAGVELVMTCVRTVLSGRRTWSIPKEYLEDNVSETVCRIVPGSKYI